VTPDLGRGTGVNQRVSRFSRRESPVPRRSGDWWHWLLLLTMTLLGFGLRQDQREIFVLPTRDDFPAFRPKEWDFLPVIGSGIPSASSSWGLLAPSDFDSPSHAWLRRSFYSSRHGRGVRPRLDLQSYRFVTAGSK
jgi:hypothetical protein